MRHLDFACYLSEIITRPVVNNAGIAPEGWNVSFLDVSPDSIAKVSKVRLLNRGIH